MKYTDIFSTYKSISPPERFNKTYKIVDEPEEEEYDILDFLMPRAISSKKRQSEPEEQLPPSNNYKEIVMVDQIEEPIDQPVVAQPVTQSSVSDDSLIRLDIEDLLRQEGITSINGKKIKFGNKNLRAANASYGVKNSNHKRRDPYTGNAMARDISIIGGSTQDYQDFRTRLLSNPRVVQYLSTKGWGIINEITPSILRRTRGTGPHFHFGPDRWAKRTWQAWLNNPNLPITQSV